MVNRYSDLLAALPRGKTYSASGDVLPYRDAQSEFRFETDADRSFEVYLNDVFQGFTQSDGDGVAIVRTSSALDPGTYEVVIIDQSDGRAFRATITIKHLATWLAATADVVEEMDAHITDMEDARSIETVGSSYIENVYGALVRQPDPSHIDETDPALNVIWSVDAYRNLLQALRPAYRHYGAHPLGLRHAVESFTSVTPLIVPSEWRPHWVPDGNLFSNGDLSARARTATAMESFAGATNELTALNAASTLAVHALFVGPGTFPGPFTQPPYPQRLTVTFDDLSADAVTITGTDELGNAISEAVAAPGPDAVIETALTFASVTGAVGATIFGASIGLADSRFVRLLDIGPYNRIDDIDMARAAGPTLTWDGGEPVDVSTGGTFTLHGQQRKATLCGRMAASAGSYDFQVVAGPDANLHERLYVSIDGGQKTSIDVDSVGGNTGTDTTANIVSAINTALGFSCAASVTGTEGDASVVVRLRTSTAGPTSSIRIMPGPSDASLVLLGLPRSSTMLVEDADTGSPDIVCASIDQMPEVVDVDEDAFDIRIRGLRRDASGAADGQLLDIIGTTVLISSGSYQFTQDDVGGWVRISGAANSANNGIHRIYQVDADEARLTNERASTGVIFIAESSIEFAVYGQGEVRTVIGTDRVSGTLTLDDEPSFAWPIGAFVEMVDETPYTIRGTEGIDEVTVEVDPDFDPGDSPTDTVTIVGSPLPDGVFSEDVTFDNLVANSTFSNASGPSGQAGLLSPSRLIAKSTGGNDVMLRWSVPRVLDYLGQEIRVSVFARDHTATVATGTTLSVSFDASAFSVFETTTLSSAPLNLAGDVGPLVPQQVTGTFFVPYDATSCTLQFLREGSATVSIERILVQAVNASGLALGDNTIPRNAKRTNFGEVLYVWSREQLSADERLHLGIPEDTSTSAPEGPGHIDYITNAHGFWERFDISEYYDDGTPKNIVGVYDDVEWTTIETDDRLSNMDVVVGTPPKTSYARPTRVSLVESEVLTVVAPTDATLSEVSDHEGSFPQSPMETARLYEVVGVARTISTNEGVVVHLVPGDLVPVPSTPGADSVQPWQFLSANTIRIHASYYESTSSYVIDYSVLMRATTGVIDVAQNGTPHTEYVWLTDFTTWERRDIIDTLRGRTEQAEFRADFTAPLTDHADTTSGTAVLSKNNGLFEETVSTQSWSFVDSKTVRVDSTVFDANALYVITYDARVPVLGAPAQFAFEWRGSNEPNGDDLSDDSAPWVEVTNNQVVSASPDGGSPTVYTSYRYHQLRVTIAGVIDVRDFRILGLGVKGIHMYGSTPSAPGILTNA